MEQVKITSPASCWIPGAALNTGSFYIFKLFHLHAGAGRPEFHLAVAVGKEFAGQVVHDHFAGNPFAFGEAVTRGQSVRHGVSFRRVGITEPDHGGAIGRGHLDPEARLIGREAEDAAGDFPVFGDFDREGMLGGVLHGDPGDRLTKGPSG